MIQAIIQAPLLIDERCCARNLCDLDLHAGEVLGIAGLVGAGRTELAHLIFGGQPRTRGEVKLGDKTFGAHSPRDAIDAGLVYLTEDRKRQGLFLDMSVRDNINISVANRDAQGGVLNLARGAERARDAISSLSIRVPHANVNAGALSGGNQQKVLLSRLLETKPRVLILDEPTRGVDVGAKAEIHALVDELASGGAGELDHLVEALKGGADAALCASIFHYGRHTVGEAKAHLTAAGVPVRYN